MENYYTAAEAAKILGLEYKTFLARVRNGQYPFERFGHMKVFLKTNIDNKAQCHAPNSQALETAAR